jgi:predicted small lipoprotein YifL
MKKILSLLLALTLTIATLGGCGGGGGGQLPPSANIGDTTPTATPTPAPTPSPSPAGGSLTDGLTPADPILQSDTSQGEGLWGTWDYWDEDSNLMELNFNADGELYLLITDYYHDEDDEYQYTVSEATYTYDGSILTSFTYSNVSGQNGEFEYFPLDPLIEEEASLTVEGDTLLYEGIEFQRSSGPSHLWSYVRKHNIDSTAADLVGTWDYWDEDEDVWEWNFNDQGEYYVILIVYDSERNPDWWKVWDGTYTVADGLLVMHDNFAAYGGSLSDEDPDYFDPPDLDQREFYFSGGNLFIQNEDDYALCSPSSPVDYWDFSQRNNY